jgi:hypothetical protein
LRDQWAWLRENKRADNLAQVDIQLEKLVPHQRHLVIHKSYSLSQTLMMDEGAARDAREECGRIGAPKK